MGKINVEVTKLREATERALKRQGWNEEETKMISKMLLFAQLRGSNQGVVKLIGGGMPKDKTPGNIEINKETKFSALLNGNQNHGIVVMNKAIKMAQEKVDKMGFAVIGTYNTSTTSGALTYYGDFFARSGYISLVFSGSPPAVAPYGTNQPLFGTNPICIGVPSKTEPIVLDMATSAMAWYGLVEAKTEKRDVPINIGYDVDGNPTTDPSKILDGAIRPFDQGHKSGGLNLMVEILTGPLVKASFASFGDVDNWGNLMIVFDPKIFTEDIATDVARLVDKVKSLRRENKNQEVFVPGERGGNEMKKALETGKCPIEENLWNALLRAAGMSSKL